MDGQFESIRGDLAEMQINLNTVPTDEHVPEVGRYICTIKDAVSMTHCRFGEFQQG